MVALAKYDFLLTAQVFRCVDELHGFGDPCLVVRAEAGDIHGEEKTGSGRGEGDEGDVFRNPQIQLIRAVDQFLAGALFIADPCGMLPAAECSKERGGISVVVADDIFFQTQFRVHRLNSLNVTAQPEARHVVDGMDRFLLADAADDADFPVAVAAEQLRLTSAGVGMIRVKHGAVALFALSDGDQPDSRLEKFAFDLPGSVHGSELNQRVRSELHALLQAFIAVPGQKQRLIPFVGAGFRQEAHDVVVIHPVDKAEKRTEENHQLPFAGGVEFPGDVVAAPAHLIDMVEDFFPDLFLDARLAVDRPRDRTDAHAAGLGNVLDGQIPVFRHLFVFSQS